VSDTLAVHACKRVSSVASRARMAALGAEAPDVVRVESKWLLRCVMTAENHANCANVNPLLCSLLHGGLDTPETIFIIVFRSSA